MKMKKIMSLALGTALVILAAGFGQNCTAGEGQPDRRRNRDGCGRNWRGKPGRLRRLLKPEMRTAAAPHWPGKRRWAGTFCLEYPAHMQELGYTDIIEMDVMPERIVCLTTYPVMTLYDMGVSPFGRAYHQCFGLPR